MEKENKNKPMTRKTALILGGNSSLSQSISSELDKLNVDITKTFRKKLNTPNEGKEFSILDISKTQEIEVFLEQIKDKEYDFVINLIGSVSRLNNISSYRTISEYFNVYTTNLIYIFDNLFLDSRLAKKGRILHISSRAAKYGSYDRFYAASKSGLEAYIKSVPRSIESEISINAVSAGLILNSKMFFDMEVLVRRKHINKSEKKLLTRDKIAKSIVKILIDPNARSGQIIELGPQYD